MNYTKYFKEVVTLNNYVGTGNPNSKILIIGKEVATDEEKDDLLEKNNLKAFNSNAEDWENNIKNNLKQNEIPNWNIESKQNNPLFAFKGVKPSDHKEGETWRKYQKLHNFIFPEFSLKNNNEPYNFQERFFITEMSELPSKKTKNAQRKKEFQDKLKDRKKIFLNSNFIQNFPIVILACSNYINGQEITKIFNVEFTEQKGNGKQRYWIHKSLTEKPKLVIHTRQLSSNVTDELLIGIANEIKKFLNSEL